MEPRIQYANTQDGVSIAYWSVGEGDPVVFMGSIWGAIAIASVFPIYAEIRDALLDSGLRVIIYDGRGTGSSQRDALDFSLEAKVLDLEAVINHLELRNPAVLGINYATPPAVAFAAAHPGRLSKLVLVGPYTNGQQYFSSTPTLRSLVAMEKLAESEWEVYVKTAAANVTGFTETPAGIDQMAAMMRDSMTQEGYLLFRNAAVSFDVTDMLSDVRAPTLVVHSESSVLSSSDIAQHVASSIQGAELVATEDRASAIRDFLAPGEATPAASSTSADIGGLRH